MSLIVLSATLIAATQTHGTHGSSMGLWDFEVGVRGRRKSAVLFEVEDLPALPSPPSIPTKVLECWRVVLAIDGLNGDADCRKGTCLSTECAHKQRQCDAEQRCTILIPRSDCGQQS